MRGTSDIAKPYRGERARWGGISHSAYFPAMRLINREDDGGGGTSSGSEGAEG